MKTNLLEDLWLPFAIEGGKILYPRRRNKKMKLLTLTYAKNFKEIEMLEEKNLTEKEHITAWTSTYIVQVRLETELGPATIIGSSRYEDSITHQNFKIRDKFPFDIINLDFTSQDPYFELGRVEKELASLEMTIKLQADHDNNGFVLIYTTLLNSKDMRFSQIIDTSRSISAAQPLPINNTTFSSTIQDQSEKISCLEQLYEKICCKYYSGIDYEKIIRPLNGDVTSLCSFAGILRS
jgi:hypothetical protein